MSKTESCPFHVKVLYDYEAQSNDELNIFKEDILKILENNDDWWLAEKDKRKGYVPSNFVEIFESKWETAIDQESGLLYYYNRAKGESRWDPPDLASPRLVQQKPATKSPRTMRSNSKSDTNNNTSINQILLPTSTSSRSLANNINVSSSQLSISPRKSSAENIPRKPAVPTQKSQNIRRRSEMSLLQNQIKKEGSVSPRQELDFLTIDSKQVQLHPHQGNLTVSSSKIQLPINNNDIITTTTTTSTSTTNSPEKSNNQRKKKKSNNDPVPTTTTTTSFTSDELDPTTINAAKNIQKLYRGHRVRHKSHTQTTTAMLTTTPMHHPPKDAININVKTNFPPLSIPIESSLTSSDDIAGNIGEIINQHLQQTQSQTQSKSKKSNNNKKKKDVVRNHGGLQHPQITRIDDNTVKSITKLVNEHIEQELARRDKVLLERIEALLIMHQQPGGSNSSNNTNTSSPSVKVTTTVGGGGGGALTQRDLITPRILEPKPPTSAHSDPTHKARNIHLNTIRSQKNNNSNVASNTTSSTTSNTKSILSKAEENNDKKMHNFPEISRASSPPAIVNNKKRFIQAEKVKPEGKVPQPKKDSFLPPLNGKLPAAANGNKEAIASAVADPVLSVDKDGGLKYANCRSIVYRPTAELPLNAIDSRTTGFPDASLRLRYSFGYSNHGQHGVSGGIGNGSSSSSNNNSKTIAMSGNMCRDIVWLKDGRVAFIAANIVVLMLVKSNQANIPIVDGEESVEDEESSFPRQAFPDDTSLDAQSFFQGHTAPVKCLALHPNKIFIASSQSSMEGKNCRLLVWDSSAIATNRAASAMSTETEARDSIQKNEILCDVPLVEESVLRRGITTISFSADGKLLLVLAADDSHTMVIYDWQAGEILSSSKLGSQDIYDIGFNTVLYSSFLTRHALERQKEGNLSNARNSFSIGCHTIVLCYGKHVKFITFKQILEKAESKGVNSSDNADPVDRGGFKGRPVIIPKHKLQWRCRYVVESGAGVVPKSQAMTVSPDMLCFCAVRDSLENAVDQDTGHRFQLPKGRVFTGTNTGSVYIWSHLEEKLEGGGDSTFWLPRGKLVSIITEVHDGPIRCIFSASQGVPKTSKEYPNSIGNANGIGKEGGRNPRVSERLEEEEENEEYSSSLSPGGSDDSSDNILATSSTDGVVSVWRILPSTAKNNDHSLSLPIDFTACYNFAVTGSGSDISPSSPSGVPSSLAWHPTGESLIVGTTNNSLYHMYGPCFDKCLSSSDASVDMVSVYGLIQSHAGKIRRIACHPNKPIVATVSVDRTVRLWDVHSGITLGTTWMTDRPTCIAFHPTGNILVTGNEIGEITVLRFDLNKIQGNNISNDDLRSPYRNQPNNVRNNHIVYWEILNHKSVATKVSRISKSVDSAINPRYNNGNNNYDAANNNNNNNNNGRLSQQSNPREGRDMMLRSKEVTDLCYSPTGDVLAVGTRDCMIHLLASQNGYRRVAVCKGHNSSIYRMDFSIDGLSLQSNDSSSEILFWDVTTGKQIRSASKFRDIRWATSRCIYGWSQQGIFNTTNGKIADNGSVLSSCRNHKGTMLVVSVGGKATCGQVKLLPFPCLQNAKPFLFYGHASAVLDVTFTSDDLYVISIGGEDSSMFVWDCVHYL